MGATLSSLAKYAYAPVTIHDKWSAMQIMGENYTRHGKVVDFSTFSNSSNYRIGTWKFDFTIFGRLHGIEMKETHKMGESATEHDVMNVALILGINYRNYQNSEESKEIESWVNFD